MSLLSLHSCSCSSLCLVRLCVCADVLQEVKECRRRLEEKEREMARLQTWLAERTAAIRRMERGGGSSEGDAHRRGANTGWSSWWRKVRGRGGCGSRECEFRGQSEVKRYHLMSIHLLLLLIKWEMQRLSGPGHTPLSFPLMSLQ